MNKKDRFRSVLIFGGAGFIGSNWAARLLLHTDAKVHVFDNLSRPGVRHNLDWLQKVASSSGRLQITVGDVRDGTKLERAVRYATEIYHFAAQVAVTNSLLDPRLDFDVNLGGTFNVLEAVRKAGHRPFLLFTSTNKVYGEFGTRSLVVTRTRYRHADGRGVSESQPLNFHSPYGCSKGAADQYVHDYARIYDIPTVVFRMSCIAGPRQFGTEDQGWVAHFLYSALSEHPIAIYGDGRQVRDVLDVDDLLHAFERASENREKTAGQVYNVGGGMKNTTSLLELIEEIRQVTGRRLQFKTDDRRPGDQLVYITDSSKLQSDTGWEPKVRVRQTLTNMYEWWRKNRELFPRASVAASAPAMAPGILQELPRVA